MFVSSGRVRACARYSLDYPPDLLAVIVALALDVKLHPPGGAQSRDRRRIDRQNDPLGDLRELLRRIFHQGGRALGLRVVACVTLLEILETDEKCRCVALHLAVEQAESIHHHDRFCRRVVHEIVGCVTAHRSGAVEPGGIRHEHAPSTTPWSSGGRNEPGIRFSKTKERAIMPINSRSATAKRLITTCTL